MSLGAGSGSDSTGVREATETGAWCFHGKPPLLMGSQALLSTPCKGLPQAPEICQSK